MSAEIPVLASDDSNLSSNETTSNQSRDDGESSNETANQSDDVRSIEFLAGLNNYEAGPNRTSSPVAGPSFYQPISPNTRIKTTTDPRKTPKCWNVRGNGSLIRNIRFFHWAESGMTLRSGTKKLYELPNVKCIKKFIQGLHAVNR